MAETEENIENETEKPKKKRKIFSLSSLVSGSILSSRQFIKRLPVLGFLFILMIIYMSIGFMVQKRHNEIDNLNKEITTLRTIQVTTSATRQTLTRQKNIDTLLKTHNIKMRVNPIPPRIIAK